MFEPVKVCLAECNSTEILPGSQLGKYAKAWLQKLKIINIYIVINSIIFKNSNRLIRSNQIF